MSLHHSHGDIEDARTSYILANPDATDNVELLEHPSYKNSLQSNSGVTTRNRGRPTLRKRLHATIWARVTDSFLDWWAGELLAILLSVVAFVATIVILRKYDDHKLPSLPHHVTLNFVVSTLATVTKSSLLLAVASALGRLKWLWMSSKQRRLQDLQVFDEASRGPFGASKLLASRGCL